MQYHGTVNSSNKAAKGAKLDRESFGIPSLFTAPLALGHRFRSPRSYCWALLRKSLPGERVLVPQDSGQELHRNLALTWPLPLRGPALLCFRDGVHEAVAHVVRLAEQPQVAPETLNAVTLHLTPA